MTIYTEKLIIMKNTLCSLFILLLPAVYHCQSIDHSVISSFGIDYTDATFQTECTVGEVITFSGESTENTLTQGFHQPLAIVALCQTPHEETIDANACSTYELNGETYTNAGSYTQMLLAQDGCDSIIYLNLQLNTLSNQVAIIENTLIATQENAAYAWTLCGEAEILSTSQAFTPSENGEYQVTITQDDCEVVSECVSFAVKVEEIAQAINLLVYPNPTQEFLNVQMRGAIRDCYFTVYDSFGHAVMSVQMTNPSTKFNVEGLATGAYLIVLHSNHSILTKSFVKV
jgi:hypothetical protein